MSDFSSKTGTSPGEKARMVCPYKEKCYRKNIIHFQQMAHKHLEDIVSGQLDASTITLPKNLGFACTSQENLMDQLNIVKKVLLQKRTSNLSATVGSTNVSKAENEKNLKEKIERNRLAAIERRKQKLKEAETQFKSKKLKFDESNARSSQTVSSSSPTKSKSARQEMRDKAVSKMLQNGIKVPEYKPGEFALKFAKSAPYHFFLSRVENSKLTFDQNFSVTFTELLDESLGEIVDSLHINFMVEIGWLCAQYLLAAQNPKMTIVYGSLEGDDKNIPKNITLVPVSMPSSYGCHHSKISLLRYSDQGIRIIVSTANLYSDDWENRTQGLWISPHLPQLPDTDNPGNGESPTGFKKDFKQYLMAYNHPKVNEWEHVIRKIDFSDVNVFFVGSIPGSHKSTSMNYWGSRKLAQTLSQHATLPPDASQWNIIAQASSIGSLGSTFDAWVLSTLVATMAKEKIKGIKSCPEFKFIYPSLKNYELSYDCKEGCSCFPYSRKTHEKQQWLMNYLCQWKSDKIGRTKAMPHIKTYTRVSPDGTKIPWFVLTSANLSKGAWGSTAKTGLSHFIMNYEAGVVFMPKFIIGKDTFPIRKSDSPEIPIFQMPYDLPPMRYSATDKPFVNEFLSDA